MMSCLRIKDLHVSVDGKEILKGLSLDIHSGETHALMGPNGNGKSTLLAAIMGNPKFQVTGGSITLDDQDVLAMEVDERSKAGLFLGMQYPSGSAVLPIPISCVLPSMPAGSGRFHCFPSFVKWKRRSGIYR